MLSRPRRACPLVEVEGELSPRRPWTLDQVKRLRGAAYGYGAVFKTFRSTHKSGFRHLVFTRLSGPMRSRSRTTGSIRPDGLTGDHYKSGFSSARSHGSFKQLNSFMRMPWSARPSLTKLGRPVARSRGRQSRPRSRAARCYGASTKFTSRPGTTISFSTAFPVNLDRTSGSSAASLTSSSAASVEGAWILPRSLPFT